jgi:5-methylcytosine-specific restriction endonuclease McrA
MEESLPRFENKVRCIHNAKQRQHTVQRLAAMYGYICWYCGADISGTAALKLRLDHIVPRSKGGTNEGSNLALACEVCDGAKANMSLHQFLEWLHSPKKSVYRVEEK